MRIAKTDHIIFCLSYLSVPITCQLIEENNSENVMVISNVTNIIKLISELYPLVNTLFVESNGLMPYALYKQKLFYKNKLKEIKDGNIYFFFVAYGIMESFAIRRLSKKNNIFYKKSVDISHFNISNSIKSKLWKYYLESTLGVEFNTRLVNGKLVFAVSDNFLTQLNVKAIEIPDNIENVEKRIVDQYSLSNKKILFCVGGIVEDGLVGIKEYMQKNDALIKDLYKKYGQNQIVLKMHPRFNKLHSKEKTLYSIPNYIPGNMIIDHFDIIIGYCSAILFEAANKGKKVYSTLKYFRPFDRETQNQYINYLTTNLNPKREINYL